MSKVQIMDHPLIQHKITYIRREEVGSKEFRRDRGVDVLRGHTGPEG